MGYTRDKKERTVLNLQAVKYVDYMVHRVYKVLRGVVTSMDMNRIMTPSKTGSGKEWCHT